MLTPAERITRTRTKLLLDAPFFGALGLRLKLVESTSDKCPTMQTNGTVLEYSPDFVTGLKDNELTGVLAHEILHCALRHMYRVNGRGMEEWNQACDYVVNQELLKAGFTLPDGALIDAQYAGMSAEQVYAKRGRDKQTGGTPGKTGSNGPQTPATSNGTPATPGNAQTPAPCPTGTFTAPQTPAKSDDSGNGGGTPDESMSESDWEVATEQAQLIAAKAGKMAGGVSRAVNVSREPVEDWRAILREFIENTCPSDYSWSTPNRRLIGQGIYLPGVVRENLPKIAIAVDTSGSITPAILQQFSTELTGILHDARPESLEVIYCDTAVNGTDTFSPDEPEIKLRNIGGGGTYFSPVFDHIAKWDCPPACTIYMTDMQAADMPESPDYPVLWAVPEWAVNSKYAIDPGFGRTVVLSEFA